ncbi:MAG: hypothetical protein EBX40_00240 [Gammaproteobacteria bacterium]|nr:hypothetical protein [Gammaproteobacteria bacterium]
MAFSLTEGAVDKQGLRKQEPSLVLEIDGYSKVFGMHKLLRYTRIGGPGLYIDGTWEIGGTYYDTTVQDWISLDGTTSTISQQLLQDKGGTSSITSFQISLIDFNELVTALISPGVVLDDILGREAFVYLGYKDTLFPQDYILLFNGIIDEVESSGMIKLNIANPEQKKRQDIFPQIETDLNGAINNLVTTITLDSVTNLVLPVAGVLETYVRVDDEIIRYTGINTGTNQITGCTRTQFGTIAVNHSDGASVSSFLRFQGTAIELALYLMLSGPNEYYKTDYPVSNFGIDGSGNINLQGIFFAGVDMETKWGLTVGSYITTTGASLAANNVTLRQITSISTTADGTFVILNGAALAVEGASSALAKFKSQYNILPDGLGMGAHQVDVDEFERIDQLFTSSIPIYDFYVTDTINGKDFIDKEILFPANLYSLPKKGKSSLGVVSPPLAIATLPQLNADTVTKPSSIKIKRAIGKYFYNTVIYKFNFDAVETDKPLSGYIKIDTDSQAQIPVGTKAITIASKGLRNDPATQTILDINSRRLLEKYKYAAEAITLSCFYSVGFNIDVGDVVYFGDADLNLPDSVTGVRGFTPRLCEVIDKRMNIFNGTVDLVIIDTSYLASGRYGIFSPASKLGIGSTTSSLILTDSFGTTAPDIEQNKWQDYINQNILIHNDNFSVTYNSQILGFNPSNPYEMYIDPIASAPAAGFTVDIAFYPASVDPEINFVLKNVFVFADPSVAVVTGVSDKIFTVGAGDVGKFLVGATVLLHNAAWASVSPEVKVSAISGTQITVDRSLGLTPSSLYTVELIGFPDGGPAYRYI